MRSPPPIRILLVAPAGGMGGALRAFLRTVAGVQLLGQVEGPAAALAAVAGLAPAGLVLDAAAAGAGLAELVGALRAAAPGLNLVVLVDGVEAQARALAAGASQALLKGHLEAQLRRALLAGGAGPGRAPA